MEVKPGYKQTEVGVIPEEWRLPKLVELIDPARGVRYGIVQPGKYDARGRYMVRGQDYSDGWVDPSELFRVSPQVEEPFKNARIKAGDILITIVGASTGRIAVTPDWLEGANLTQTTARLAFSANAADSRYCAFVLWSWYGSRQVANYIKGGAQPGLNCGDIEKFLIPLPPTMTEQRAIAEALNDVDGLLGGLDRLIAKKRDLKQAAMQQLLTGQTRLPGFHGEWEVKTLKQAAEISTGINKPLSEMGSGALYVTVQDLYDATSIRTDRLSRIKVSRAEIEAKALAVGDIVFGKSSVKRDGIGYPSQFLGCNEPVVFSGFTYRARARQGAADAIFLFYALRTAKTRRWLIDNSQASALTNINQKIADAIPLQLPPTPAEQTAIAEVLTEMDMELAGLEQRREKTRALKQAMMQELLTGKTRIVSPAQAHA